MYAHQRYILATPNLENKHTRGNIRDKMTCIYVNEKSIKPLIQLVFIVMDPLTIYLLSKLTGSQKPQDIMALGTIHTLLMQPLILPTNGGTLYISFTQPLINNKIPLPLQIRVFLRYRSIKANQALKSPRIRRILKPVATATIFTVFSVNPLSLSNCRTRRTSTPHLALKMKFNVLAITNTHYEE